MNLEIFTAFGVMAFGEYLVNNNVNNLVNEIMFHIFENNLDNGHIKILMNLDHLPTDITIKNQNKIN